MATLKNFTAPTHAINEGEWVDVGTGDELFRIKTRGFTRKYRDKLNALRREAVRAANRRLPPGETFFTVDTLGPNDEDRCQAIAIADEAFLDVQGLTNEGGGVVTAEMFREMLRDPETFGALLVLAIGAASRVHTGRQDEAQAAEGNSEGGSKAL
jgi:hypothetical protein